MSGKDATILRPIRYAWIVAVVLFLSLAATFAVFFYERASNIEKGSLRFDQASDAVKTDLTDTFRAYAQFLRAGVSLIQTNNELTRADWTNFVETQEIATFYPGIQGVSFNGFIQSQPEVDRLVAELRRKDWPEFAIIPPGPRDTYAPIIYIEPYAGMNARAIGFDIYSETIRRAAVDHAIATGEPSATGKITLLQENLDGSPDEIQAGILVILPITDPDAEDRRAGTSGLVVSVFRMGDLIASILENADESRMSVSVFDTASDDPDTSLFTPKGPAYEGRFTRSTDLYVFGRGWTLVTQSSRAFDDEAVPSGHIIMLIAGCIMSLLLTALTAQQARLQRDMRVSTNALSQSYARISFLMRETNHRSKNLLALVQAIARQTSRGNPQDFSASFSKRLDALAASQDLLVKSSWQAIDLNELILSQLSHFEDLVGTRIALSGAPLQLSAAAAQTLGIALHELATNASKYGALSNAKGTIDVAWSVDDAASPRFHITWIEKSGPPVTTPTRRGFGSKVTGDMAKLSLQGRVSTEFISTGLQWRLDCPFEKVKYTPTPDAPKLTERT